MSTTAAAPATTASLTGNDNMFVMHDADNKTQVTYMPRRGGPIIAGTAPNGASLEYKGAEGSLTFTDGQVTTEPTSIGSLITVTLNVVPDLRILTFSVLIPDVVNKTAGSPQSFQTIAVKAAHHTTLIGQPPAGGNPTYQEFKMQGTAKAVETAD